MLKFSSKLWVENHGSRLLPKEHLEILDGLPVTEFKNYYKVDCYEFDNQKWTLYPIDKKDCIDDISLF